MYDYQYMCVNAWGHLQEVDEDVDIDVDVAAAADTGTGKHDDTHIGKEIRHGIGIYAHTKRDAVTATGIDSNVDADIDIFTTYMQKRIPKHATPEIGTDGSCSCR